MSERSELIHEHSELPAPKAPLLIGTTTKEESR
ncbi:MAG: hypothetical protein QOD30_2472 [Actinomycetota bacterium]|jgi:hypothetical protein|nr:hypothetical protein [Actinomycetota bacterium]